jgi:hypothetical protein
MLYPEIESWMSFLVEVLGHKFMSRLGFSCFVDFFCKDFLKNRRRVWFSLKSACRRYCEKHGAKDSSFVKLMSKNSISVLSGGAYFR